LAVRASSKIDSGLQRNQFHKLKSFLDGVDPVLNNNDRYSPYSGKESAPHFSSRFSDYSRLLNDDDTPQQYQNREI
jgi:hypothetical protein